MPVRDEMRMTLTWKKPPKAMLKAGKAAIKDGLKEVVRYWWEKFLPNHFENRAKSEYDYAPRTAGTEIKKAIHQGHRRPLAKEGTLQQRMESQLRITSTSKTGTGRMKATQYIDIRQRRKTGGIAPDKRAELTTVTREEGGLLAALLANGYTKRINSIRKTMRA